MENCRDYLQKGPQVSVEGTVRANAYLDINKNLRASLNINAKEVVFLNRTKHRENQDGHAVIDNAMKKSEQNRAYSPQQQSLEQSRYSFAVQYVRQTDPLLYKLLTQKNR